MTLQHCGLCRTAFTVDGNTAHIKAHVWAVDFGQGGFPLEASEVDLDRFYDEAFPNDPCLSGEVRTEIDRMRGRDA